jgi:hypothetical protein
MRRKKESLRSLPAKQNPCYNGLVLGRLPDNDLGSSFADAAAHFRFAGKTKERLSPDLERERGDTALTPTFAGSGTSYVSAEQIEDVVRQLKDVVSVRALLSPSGSIEELHVLVNARRAPKQVTRDIESALIAHLGITLDYKKISIAQAQPRSSLAGVAAPLTLAPGSIPAKSRMRIADVSLTVHGTRADATVHLQRDDQIFTGLSTGHASSHNQLRLIATAAIRSVENKAGEDGTMVVEDVCGNVNLAGRTAVVVLVSVISDRGEEHLTGCALVRQDLWKAAVSATLDAVNRRMAAQSSFEEEFA